MATVAQVAKASLQLILVQGSEAPFEADEYQDYIFALNNYMTQLDADGIQLGYTLVSDLGDEVTVPAGAIRGIIANMAIEVAPMYGGMVSEGLALAAKQGMDTMRKIGQSMGETFYPSTLPVGSGNYGGWAGIEYYPGPDAEILAESTGSIALESET